MRVKYIMLNLTLPFFDAAGFGELEVDELLL